MIMTATTSTATPQRLCSGCAFRVEKSARSYTTLFDFPYKGFGSKEEMATEITRFAAEWDGAHPDTSILFQLKPDKYKNTILHELVYLIGCKTYSEKQYRRQYLWAFEIIAERPEFPALCRVRNAKGETPIFIHIMLSEDHETTEYHTIRVLLERHSEEQVVLSGQDERTLPSLDLSRSETEDSAARRLYEPDRRSTNPEVKRLTAEYHRIQDRLFQFFYTIAPDCITRCHKCGDPIDIFTDFDQIVASIIASQNTVTLGFVRHNLTLLIQYRRKCIAISEQNAITKRHKHIADVFDRLKEKLDTGIQEKTIPVESASIVIPVETVPTPIKLYTPPIPTKTPRIERKDPKKYPTAIKQPSPKDKKNL